MKNKLTPLHLALSLCIPLTTNAMENQALHVNQETPATQEPYTNNLLDRCSTRATQQWLITEAPTRYRLATICTRCWTATEAVAGLCSLGIMSRQFQEIVATHEQPCSLGSLANQACQSTLCGLLTFLSHTWAQEQRQEARLWKNITKTAPTHAISMQNSTPKTVPALLEKNTVHDTSQ